jgi:hypothetical protein
MVFASGEMGLPPSQRLCATYTASQHIDIGADGKLTSWMRMAR